MDALLYEIELQKDYLAGETIESVYLGGGTPSLLTIDELNRIFEQLHRHHQIASDAEITLEANPDDLSLTKLKAFQQSSVNRLSIGIQSFFEEDLTFMNRAHNAAEAENCIDLAKAEGFDNLSIDLIYGSPSTAHDNWQHNVEKAIEKQVNHLSCYCLTVEPNTALDHMVRKGKAQAVDEEKAAQQFEYLIQRLTKEGFLHYEISNFARPDHFARHNSSYWKRKKYLGLGPAAHSFNGHSRQWNVANNSQYIKAIHQGVVPFEVEHLTKVIQYNEYVMTSLRTMWGCQKNILQSFGDTFSQHFRANIETPIEKGWVLEKELQYELSTAGKLLADGIAMSLFMEEE